MKQLSIIIPVYQVEKYVRPCLESVFRQGLDEDCFEVIIVDDGSTDNSMNSIADLISSHPNISVITQKNQGLSVARNNGLAKATGEYVIMPDSDDLLIDNSLQPLLEKAISSKVDLIVADFMEMYDEEIEARKDVSQKPIAFEEKTGEELFLNDLNPYQCYVWRTLFRRDFLIKQRLTFVHGVFFQDVPFTHECYLKAKKCLRTHWLLNIYRHRHESATKGRFTLKKAKDFSIVIAKTWELKRLPGLSNKIQEKLMNDVFISFSSFFYSSSHDLRKVAERTEAMAFLKQQAPNLKFTNGKKQQFTSFMLKHFPLLFIHIRHYYGFLLEDHLFPFLRKLKKK